MKHLLQRIITFLVPLPVVLAACLLPADWPAVAMVVAAAALCALEACALLRLRGVSRAFAIVAAAAAPVCVWAGAGPWALAPWLAAVVTAGGLLALAEPIGSAAWQRLILAAVYCGALPAHGVAMKMRIPGGGRFLLWTLFVVWAADAAAYLVGRAVGRRPLFPRVSPKKTVEGLLGSCLGAVLVGVVGYVLLRPELSAAQALILPVVLSLVGAVGDLVESALKREAGVKDSGKLLPGHGGMLDALDSAMFAVPAAFWLWIVMEMR